MIGSREGGLDVMLLPDHSPALKASGFKPCVCHRNIDDSNKSLNRGSASDITKGLVIKGTIYMRQWQAFCGKQRVYLKSQQPQKLFRPSTHPLVI